MIVRRAGPLPPRVPPAAVTVERVPGARPRVAIGVVPPALVAVPDVQVRREPAAARVAHRVVGHPRHRAAILVNEDQTQPRDGGQARKHGDRKPTSTGLDMGHGGGSDAARGGKLALREVGAAPDPAQGPHQVELAHPVSVRPPRCLEPCGRTGGDLEPGCGSRCHRQSLSRPDRCDPGTAVLCVPGASRAQGYRMTVMEARSPVGSGSPPSEIGGLPRRHPRR